MAEPETKVEEPNEPEEAEDVPEFPLVVYYCPSKCKKVFIISHNNLCFRVQVATRVLLVWLKGLLGVQAELERK